MTVQLQTVSSLVRYVITCSPWFEQCATFYFIFKITTSIITMLNVRCEQDVSPDLGTNCLQRLSADDKSPHYLLRVYILETNHELYVLENNFRGQAAGAKGA